MNKIDITTILKENHAETQKLIREHGKPCMGNMKEIELNEDVDVIIGVDDGKVTKVRTFDEDDCGVEFYYTNGFLESVWVMACDFAYGTENNVYLALAKMFE